MGFLTSILSTPRFRAATPENPRFDINSAAAWDYLTEGSRTSAGVCVTRAKAQSYSPWFRGVTLLSRDVAKLPLFVYERTDGGKERATEHPAYQLLRYQPNANQNALSFREQLTGHALTCGNGYAYIQRDADGTPLELLPLDPESTYPVREAGVKWYVANGDRPGEMVKLLAVDVLHIHGFSWDGMCGVDVLTAASEAIGKGLAQQKYESVFYKNGARPAVTLEVPMALDPKAKTELRESWARLHEGVDNQYRTAILDRGMKANALSFSPEDSQSESVKKLTTRDIANFLGIPSNKLGDDARTAYASLEQENQDYLDSGLDYWLCVWEFECRAKLLSDQERADDSHFVEFLRVARLRGDSAARANYYRTALGGRPWMLPDEVRDSENMNTLGGEAAQYLNPLNMGQGGQDNQGNKPPDGAGDHKPGKPPMDDAVAAARDGLADAVARCCRRVSVSARRAAKHPPHFTAWVEGISIDHHSTIATMLSPAVDTLNALIGRMSSAISVADHVVGSAMTDLTRISGEATAKTLGQAVEKWIGDYERGTPDEVDGFWFPAGA